MISMFYTILVHFGY